MTRAAEPPRRLVVAVALDTSVIKTTGTELVTLDVKRLIDTTYEHLDVRWQVPRIVVLERQHQMVTDGLTLLKHRAHLEFLTQQKLAALSESNVEERVATFIAGQLAALRLEVLELNAGAIGWDALIEDAARRRGVFKGSDNREKGFRDRLIAETFMQHPNTEPDYARRAFVTADPHLAAYVTSRVGANAAVAVLNSVSELTTHLGTLNSQLQEALVAILKPLASEMFLDASGGGLFLASGVPERITAKYRDVLARIPDGATRRELVGWSVDSPTFIGLLPGRVTEWESRVVSLSRVTRPDPTGVRTYTYRFDDDISTWRSPGFDAPKLVDKYGTAIGSTEGVGLFGGSTGYEEQQETVALDEVFAVRWTAALSGERLSNPGLRGEVEHIESRGLQWGGLQSGQFRSRLGKFNLG